MKGINENQERKYLIQFIEEGMFETYDFDKLYFRGVEEKFKEAFPDYYLRYEERTSTFDVANLNISYPSSRTYEDIIEDFQKYLDENSSEDTQFNVNEVKSKLAWTTSNFKYNGSGEFQEFSSYGLHNLDALFTLLYFITQGEIAKDRSIGMEIEDNHGLRSLNDNLSFNEVFPELGNITIKMYKNGKIIVKGLSQDQLDLLEEVWNILKK